MSTGQEKEPGGSDCWDDMVSAFLREPFHEMPGEVFRYNSIATYMLSESLKKKGIDLEHYLEEKLLTPMGISGTRWLRDPKGICVGGFGFSLYPEVIAKLGQMILQGGIWNGIQLVPKDYIDMKMEMIQTVTGRRDTAIRCGDVATMQCAETVCMDSFALSTKKQIRYLP